MSNMYKTSSVSSYGRTKRKDTYNYFNRFMTTLKNMKKTVKTRRIYGASVIGNCFTCGKEFMDYLNRRDAYNHARNTGHSTAIEVSVNFKYN